jgi:signal transduction histidine kinase
VTKNQKESPENVGFSAIDERLLRMDRLAQVGQLAASLAHEIRNPLAGISANVQVLADQLKNNLESQPFIDIVMEEIQRVDRILKDLLGFARQGKPVFQPLFLKDVFTQVKALVSAQLRTNNIHMDVELTDSLPTLHADLSQMIQIFLNLILNASQAMPNGGRITINAQTETEKLRVNVEDTGCGMESHTLQKMFDPFFSTKAFGLGLGLSVAHKIMEDHGGQIEAQSTLGVGTKIILLFPLRTESL